MDALLLASNIWKAYGGTQVLRGVSIQLKPGVTAIVGPNGSGKTTLMRILALLEAPDAGHLRVLGHDVHPGSRDAVDRFRGRVVLLPQEPVVFNTSVLKNLTLSPASSRSDALMWADAFGLTGQLGANAAKLSPGLRRRVQLAMLLACRPLILLLDEPTNHLDEEAKGTLFSAIERLRGSMAIAYVTHYPPELSGLRPDHIYELRRGTLVEQAAHGRGEP